MSTNGHGHVRPNADGSKTRCGGPPHCGVCNAELATLNTPPPPPPATPGELTEVQRIAALEAEVNNARAALDDLRELADGRAETIGMLQPELAKVRAELESVRLTVAAQIEETVKTRDERDAALSTVATLRGELAALRQRKEPSTPACTCGGRGKCSFCHYGDQRPATPGGEVADVLRRIDWLYQHTPRECVHDDVHRQVREGVDRLSRALAASEEARKAAERERDEERAVTAAFDDGLKAGEEGKTSYDNPWAFAGSEYRRATGWIAGRNLWAWKHERIALEADRDRLRAELATARERLGKATRFRPATGFGIYLAEKGWIVYRPGNDELTATGEWVNEDEGSGEQFPTADAAFAALATRGHGPAFARHRRLAPNQHGRGGLLAGRFLCHPCGRAHRPGHSAPATVCPANRRSDRAAEKPTPG